MEGKTGLCLLGDGFAIAAELALELIPDRALEQVPLAPPEVLGLTVDRGRLLTVLALSGLLGCEPQPDSARSLLLILRPPHSHLALRVPSALKLGPAPQRGIIGRREIRRQLNRIAGSIAAGSAP